jgi:ribonuclease T1
MAVRQIWMKCLFYLFALALSFSVIAKGVAVPTVPYSELPREAQRTVELIKQGGPYPYPKDGAVFGNYEKILPKQRRGYYHEFTVKTGGAHNRGARRIIVGGPLGQPHAFYYTNDHYASFRRITE